MQKRSTKHHKSIKQQINAFRIAGLTIATIAILFFYYSSKNQSPAQLHLRCDFLAEITSNIEYRPQDKNQWAIFYIQTIQENSKQQEQCQNMLNKSYRVELTVTNESLKTLINKKKISLRLEIKTKTSFLGLQPLFRWQLSKDSL